MYVYVFIVVWVFVIHDSVIYLSYINVIVFLPTIKNLLYQTVNIFMFPIFYYFFDKYQTVCIPDNNKHKNWTKKIKACR